MGETVNRRVIDAEAAQAYQKKIGQALLSLTSGKAESPSQGDIDILKRLPTDHPGPSDINLSDVDTDLSESVSDTSTSSSEFSDSSSETSDIGDDTTESVLNDPEAEKARLLEKVVCPILEQYDAAQGWRRWWLSWRHPIKHYRRLAIEHYSTKELELFIYQPEGFTVGTPRQSWLSTQLSQESSSRYHQMRELIDEWITFSDEEPEFLVRARQERQMVRRRTTAQQWLAANVSSQIEAWTKRHESSLGRRLNMSLGTIDGWSIHKSENGKPPLREYLSQYVIDREKKGKGLGHFFGWLIGRFWNDCETKLQLVAFHDSQVVKKTGLFDKNTLSMPRGCKAAVQQLQQTVSMLGGHSKMFTEGFEQIAQAAVKIAANFQKRKDSVTGGAIERAEFTSTEEDDSTELDAALIDERIALLHEDELVCFKKNINHVLVGTHKPEWVEKQLVAKRKASLADIEDIQKKYLNKLVEPLKGQERERIKQLFDSHNAKIKVYKRFAQAVFQLQKYYEFELSALTGSSPPENETFSSVVKGQKPVHVAQEELIKNFDKLESDFIEEISAITLQHPSCVLVKKECQAAFSVRQERVREILLCVPPRPGEKAAAMNDTDNLRLIPDEIRFPPANSLLLVRADSHLNAHHYATQLSPESTVFQLAFRQATDGANDFEVNLALKTEIIRQETMRLLSAHQKNRDTQLTYYPIDNNELDDFVRLVQASKDELYKHYVALIDRQNIYCKEEDFDKSATDRVKALFQRSWLDNHDQWMLYVRLVMQTAEKGLSELKELENAVKRGDVSLAEFESCEQKYQQQLGCLQTRYAELPLCEQIGVGQYLTFILERCIKNFQAELIFCKERLQKQYRDTSANMFELPNNPQEQLENLLEYIRYYSNFFYRDNNCKQAMEYYLRMAMALIKAMSGTRIDDRERFESAKLKLNSYQAVFNAVDAALVWHNNAVKELRQHQTLTDDASIEQKQRYLDSLQNLKNVDNFSLNVLFLLVKEGRMGSGLELEFNRLWISVQAFFKQAESLFENAKARGQVANSERTLIPIAQSQISPQELVFRAIDSFYRELKPLAGKLLPGGEVYLPNGTGIEARLGYAADTIEDYTAFSAFIQEFRLAIYQLMRNLYRPNMSIEALNDAIHAHPVFKRWLRVLKKNKREIARKYHSDKYDKATVATYNLVKLEREMRQELNAAIRSTEQQLKSNADKLHRVREKLKNPQAIKYIDDQLDEANFTKAILKEIRAWYKMFMEEVKVSVPQRYQEMKELTGEIESFMHQSLEAWSQERLELLGQLTQAIAAREQLAEGSERQKQRADAAINTANIRFNRSFSYDLIFVKTVASMPDSGEAFKKLPGDSDCAYVFIADWGVAFVNKLTRSWEIISSANEHHDDDYVEKNIKAMNAVIKTLRISLPVAEEVTDEGLEPVNVGSLEDSATQKEYCLLEPNITTSRLNKLESCLNYSPNGVKQSNYILQVVALMTDNISDFDSYCAVLREQADLRHRLKKRAGPRLLEHYTRNDLSLEGKPVCAIKWMILKLQDVADFCQRSEDEILAYCHRLYPEPLTVQEMKIQNAKARRSLEKLRKERAADRADIIKMLKDVDRRIEELSAGDLDNAEDRELLDKLRTIKSDFSHYQVREVGLVSQEALETQIFHADHEQIPEKGVDEQEGFAEMLRENDERIYEVLSGNYDYSTTKRLLTQFHAFRLKYSRYAGDFYGNAPVGSVQADERAQIEAQLSDSKLIEQSRRISTSPARIMAHRRARSNSLASRVETSPTLDERPKTEHERRHSFSGGIV
ncbi:MAG: hypothetical protein CMF50_06910 [Legionellales bacterium]|nr:hypothetical protein [Legionellales bacterium]|tara:strand:+ start:11977 stop:17343 length:5367 start_codon:yes stop_codon:yes gene_type:complete